MLKLRTTIYQWIFLGIAILGGTATVTAGPPRGIPFPDRQQSGGGGVVAKAVLDGSLHQIKADSSVTVEDSTFYNPSYTGQLDTSYTVQDVVTLKINEASIMYLRTAFTVTAQLQISYANAAGDTASVIRNFTINYDSAHTYNSRSSYVFNGAHRVMVKVLSVTTNVTAWDPTSVLIIEDQLIARPDFVFSCTNTVTGISINPSTDPAADELPVSWTAVLGADQYDLEWAYVDTSVLRKNRYHTPVDPNLVFQNNGTRVTVTSTSYNIPLIYDDSGTLFIRVRPVRLKGANAVEPAIWSSDATPSVLGRYSFLGHVRALNWQANISYGEEGKRKIVVQYYDGSLRGRQTVTKDNTSNTLVVAETYYDYQGRVAIQVLPAPSLNNIIKYTAGFNNSINGVEYSQSNYDTLPNPGVFCSIHGDSMSNSSGASQYYSQAFPGRTAGLNQFIPDAHDYPFTETEFTPDHTGRISRQGGVGPDHQLGGGHETKYFYGTPDQNELDALFGTEVGDRSHYFKDMVRDANGQYRVTYSDMHSRIIATALAGQSPAGMAALPSNTSATVTENLTDSNSMFFQGLSMTSQKSLLVPTAGNYQFRYALNPAIFNDTNCQQQNVCYTCLYDLEITITDNCNNQLLGGKPFDTVVHNFTLGSITPNCSPASTSFNFTLNLPEGSYQVNKTLTVSQDAYNYYRDSIYLPNNVCTSLQQFINNQKSVIAATNTQCAPTCSACRASVGDWTQFWTNYKTQAGISGPDTASYVQAATTAYQNALSACDVLCQDSLTDDNDILNAMLADMTPPFGQYADTARAINKDPYSIFYAPTTDTNYIPVYKLAAIQYKDADGNPDSVYNVQSGIMVDPNSLSTIQFVQNFRSSWAYALLPYHPEYCKLLALQAQKPSGIWDRKVQAIDDYQTAVNGGYLNPTGNSGLAPYHIESGNIDPLSGVSTKIKSDLEAKLSLYQKAQGGNPNLSMWAVACLMTRCSSTDLSCVASFASIGNDFNPSSMCPGDLDMAWRNFRQLYLQLKQDVLYQDLLDKPTGCTPANNRIPNPTPTAEQIYAAYHQPEFTDSKTTVNRTSLQNFPKVSGPTQAGTEASNQQAVVDSFYTSNVHALAQQWLQQLAPCVSYPPSDLNNIIIPWMDTLCRMACDTAHPFGASSLPTGMSFRPYGTSYVFTSFLDIINTYNQAHGITDVLHCNAEVITVPAPYDKPAIYSNEPIYTKPSSCECTMINKLYNTYRIVGTHDASFSAYLLRTQQINMSDADLTQLLAMCNNSGSGTCTYLSHPINLPPSMQCNSGDVCIPCAQVKLTYQAYQSTYPTATPGTVAPDDTIQLQKNTLFQNYMNNRLGFNKQAWEYLQFMNNCNSQGSGGSGGSGGSTGKFSCDSLLTLQQKFDSLYPASMGDTIHVNNYGIGVKQVSHIRQFYDEGDPVSSNTTASTASLAAGTWTTSGLWYILRDNVVFDWSKLPKNITFSSASLNLYAKDSAYDVFTQGGAHFRYLWNNVYGIFRRALAPTVPGVTTWSTQPAVTNTDSVTIPAITIPNNRGTSDSTQIYSNQNYLQIPFTGLANDMYQASLSGTDYGMIFRQSRETIFIYSLYNFWSSASIVSPANRPMLYINYAMSRKDLFTSYVDSAWNATYTSTQVDSIFAVGCYGGGDTTGSGSGSGSGPLLLCGRSAPLYPATGVDSTTTCTDSTFFAVSKGTELYNSYVDSLTGAFEHRYKTTCLQAYRYETFTVTHMENEYHYMLYYYDQAGNLTKTIPPAGVQKNTDSTWLANVKTARTAGQVLVPTHSLATNYRYNTLNKVIAQQTPDGGATYFWYDRLNRMAISQDARQRPNNQYSFTIYDSISRITEAGQLVSGTPVTDTISRVEAALQQWESNAASTADQITVTTYDTAYTALSDELTPVNLRNRVSWTALYNTAADLAAGNSSAAAATYYSYDVLGNVDTLVQDLKGSMAANGNRFKKIVYDFDLVSGNINQVSYQHGFADAFYHHFIYDANNRLTNVLSSTDSINWDNDAYYSYYLHGPLARIVLGQQQVQGVNYAYTLHGWLKSINPVPYTSGSFTLRPDSAGTVVAASAYNLLLNYYKGDYTPISGDTPPDNGINTALATDYRPLYNGNISSMGLSLKQLNNPLLYNYQYDQLNRLVLMDAWNRTSTAWNAITKVPDFQENIAYDPNGNIQKYKRNGNNTFAGQPISMDNLNYNYISGTNKLDYITDSVPSGNYTTDIDGQTAGNYKYDSIGNLVSDAASNISNINWTVYGKIASITKAGDTTISYTYDALGNRISKSIIHAGDTLTTWYVRDIKGNVMSVYTYGDPAVRGKDLTQTELHIYGINRLGLWKTNTDVEQAPPVTTSHLPLLNMADSLTFIRGNKLFELTNHLGNVLATVSDKRYGVSVDDSLVSYFIPEVVSANDYYPFGSLEPGRSYTESGVGHYRYGFNGKENDDEVKGPGDQIDYGMRVYDPRVGRFLSMDPLGKKFPWYTPYQFAGNKPIWAIDLDGEEDHYYTVNVVKNGVGRSEIVSVTEDETKENTWYNDNAHGPLGKGDLYTIRTETQDMDGKPVSVVTAYIYDPYWTDNFFEKLKTKESTHAGGIVFYTKNPVAGNENGEYAPGATNPDAEMELIDGLMEAIAVSKTASGAEPLKGDVKEFLESKKLLSALEALSKTLDGIDVTSSAGNAIKEKIEEHKKENAGSELNKDEKGPDAVPYDSKELKPPPVKKVIHAPTTKGVQRASDGRVTQFTSSDGYTKDGGAGKPDTVIIIKYKTPKDTKPVQKN